MLRVGTDAAWERYGREDPYFGVLAEERFHGGRLDEAARAAFFHSGETFVRSIVETVRQHIDPTFRPRRALDFGCGVGRLLIPLAGACTQVVGVDVSDAMLDETRRNCDEGAIANVELVKSDDRMSALCGEFDFIHSYIVFQHIPPRRGEAILRALLERLCDGGVGVLHFTYARRSSRLRRGLHRMRKHAPPANWAANLVQGRPWRYPMTQMNAYDLGRICSILTQAGCGEAHVRFTDHGGHLGAIFIFQKLPALHR